MTFETKERLVNLLVAFLGALLLAEVVYPLWDNWKHPCISTHVSYFWKYERWNAYYVCDAWKP